MATGRQILSDLQTILDKLHPDLWYVVSDLVAPGKALVTAATEWYPEIYYVHPDDWAQFHRKLSDIVRLRDFRTWQPIGTKPYTIVEIDPS